MNLPSNTVYLPLAAPGINTIAEHVGGPELPQKEQAEGV